MTRPNRGRPILLLAVVVAMGGMALAYNYLYKSILSRSSDAKPQNAISKSSVVNKARPVFVLRDLKGIPRTVAAWDGKVLVLNFWATWCQPCRREIPALMDLQKKYGSRGLQIIGIAVDDRDDVKKFVSEFGVNYPILAGEDDAMETATAYGNEIGVLPYSVVVSRTGYIQETYFGELSTSALIQKFVPLL